MTAKSIDKALPLIQSLWIGGRLSVMEQLCISSFLKNGHEFHLYTYNYIPNVPEGTIVKDASEIIGPDKIFKYKDRDTYAGFSNIFRYKLLFENGNYWVDTDVICLKPFDCDSDYVFASSKWDRMAGEPMKPFLMESCVIKAPINSPVMDYCYQKSTAQNVQELKFGEIGPDLLESAVKKFKLYRKIANAETFCSVPYTKWTRLINGRLIIAWIVESRIFLHRSKGLHLWNEMWRQSGADKNALFPKRSIYEKLKRRYIDET